MIRVILGRNAAICYNGKPGEARATRASVISCSCWPRKKPERQLEERNSLEIQSDESGFSYCRGGCVLVEKQEAQGKHRRGGNEGKLFLGIFHSTNGAL
jgi:hypothetical protein